jgi:hypothetical protein
MFLRLLAVQLDIESRRHIAIKTLVREDEADSGMSIGVLTHHFPTRAQFIEMCNLTALGAGHALPLLVLITYLF